MNPPTLPPAEKLAATAAKAITRRRALRNAGTVALGAALTTAYFGTRPETVRAACHWENMCGPSPICGSFRCQGYPYEYKCKPSTTTKWQKYGTAQCSGDAGVDNCWQVCYAGTLVWCCDCCAKNAGCTSCPEPGRRCARTCSGCGSSGWTTCICLRGVRSC
jgi:hypothetical protein